MPTTGLRVIAANRKADALKRVLPWGPVTRRKLARSFAAYALLYLLALFLIFFLSDAAWQGAALSIMFPGAGFLLWASTSSVGYVWAIGLALVFVTGFLLSLVIWFATGNVLLPAILWFSSVSVTLLFGLNQVTSQTALYGIDLTIGVPVLILAAIFLIFAQAIVRNQSAKLNHACGLAKAGRETCRSFILCVDQPNKFQPVEGELNQDEIKLLRLLLDRALQPVSEFNGFECIDQFQTAAIRYQINFMSYALSMVSARYLPASSAYMETAQKNLAKKSLDYRIWRYWKHENMWGNLKSSSDPIAKDNIMYSGFLGLQYALAMRTSRSDRFSAKNVLRLHHPTGDHFSYSLDELMDVLVQQYKSAPFGLLPCEPNWIYPICNAITACGVRCHDTNTLNDNWPKIEASFRNGLEQEFTTPAGQLVGARSSLTGLAIPAVGGVVMQALPCFFLNALFPGRAMQVWDMVRNDLTEKRARRVLWPIDTGNYRYSRASSYAATAAAAVEMGDSETARLLLSLLDEDCPKTEIEGCSYRPTASLWSHCVELLARCGDHNAFRDMVVGPHNEGEYGPTISSAPYPDVLIAKAQNKNGCLSAVLYPGACAGYKPLKLSNLKPTQRYRVHVSDTYDFTADDSGSRVLQIPVHGRTPVRVAQAA